MKIYVDAMGGDLAPEAPVKGALMAQEKYGVDIVLTGKTEEILKALQQCGCKELPKGMEIANAINDSGAEILIFDAELAAILPKPYETPMLPCRIAVGGVQTREDHVQHLGR